ncbi:putative membrane protein [Marvinbryantia formatexigens DSM 14469]|uniref:Membrane protein n=2 Tax=Marvinbryantia TaxID=248744 RepID=C6LBR0_9FIRM|nr:putative membrane protein [Marvinbryantia formatexigens DSM 14469]
MTGAVLWGFSGACGQYLFTNYQVDSSWLTAVRMLTAGILLTLFIFVKQKKCAVGIWRNKRDAMQVVVFAVCGLLFCQYAYLTAISYSNAGTATVLQYLGPVLIMILVCLRGRRLPTGREATAVVLAVLGTFLLATHGNLSTMVLTEKGLLWGLIAAVSLACYTLLPARIIPKWGSMVVTGYGMLIGGVVLACGIRIWQIPVHLDIRGWLAVGGVAIAGTLVAYTLYLQGVGDIGPVKASMLASIEPVSATLLAVFWLGSSFGAFDLAGFVCIMTTVFLLTCRRSGE